MKSSTPADPRQLGREANEELLLRWVNLPAPPELKPRAELLMEDYPEIFEDLRPLAGENILKSVAGIQNHLQAVWDAPTDRDREWYCFRLRQLYAEHLAAIWNKGVVEALMKLKAETLEKVRDKAKANALDQVFARSAENYWKEARFWGIHVDPSPPPNSFDRLIYALQRLGPRARHCENPDCPRPYFIASRSSQRFCSNACAAPAQREAKRRWWDSHRDQQLKKRREARRPSQQKRKRRKS